MPALSPARRCKVDVHLGSERRYGSCYTRRFNFPRGGTVPARRRYYGNTARVFVSFSELDGQREPVAARSVDKIAGPFPSPRESSRHSDSQHSRPPVRAGATLSMRRERL